MKKYKSLPLLLVFLIISTIVFRMNTLPGIGKETQKTERGRSVSSQLAQSESTQQNNENILHLYVDAGGKESLVVIQMLPDVAPAHVERIKTLVREKFYDGIIFHRVISGFMAQTGDPTGTGMSGSSLPNLKAEFSNKEKFTRGMVGMARAYSPDSANSQFFIMFEDSPHLNGQYTIWGRVTDGMSFIDALNKGEPPAHPNKIVRARLAVDDK